MIREGPVIGDGASRRPPSPARAVDPVFWASTRPVPTSLKATVAPPPG